MQPSPPKANQRAACSPTPAALARSYLRRPSACVPRHQDQLTFCTTLPSPLKPIYPAAAVHLCAWTFHQTFRSQRSPVPTLVGWEGGGGRPGPMDAIRSSAWGALAISPLLLGVVLLYPHPPISVYFLLPFLSSPCTLPSLLTFTQPSVRCPSFALLQGFTLFTGPSLVVLCHHHIILDIDIRSVALLQTQYHVHAQQARRGRLGRRVRGQCHAQGRCPSRPGR